MPQIELCINCAAQYKSSKILMFVYSGIRHFLTFLQYVKAQSKTYTEKARETQVFLVTFGNKLKTDYDNFVTDRVFINKTVTKTSEEVKNTIQEYKKLKEDRDLVLSDIDDIEEEIEEIVNATRTLMAVNTGLTLTTTGTQVCMQTSTFFYTYLLSN